MTVTLVLPEAIEQQLSACLAEPRETGGVLLVRHGEAGADRRLLARSVHFVTEGAYLERTSVSMAITSEGYVPALGLAETDGATPIWFHTHPGAGAEPYPSKYDERVDEQIADLFRLRSGSDFYGTLIFAPAASGYTFTGSIQRDGEPRQPINRIWSVGEAWRLRSARGLKSNALNFIFDRNIRAFGPEIQAVLGELMVAVVGAGGTGSAVAEQLVRLGIRKLVLVDPDTLTDSNITRVYGSTPADVGRAKVDVLAAHLKRIAPDLKCETIPAMTTLQSTARALVAADLVFGCSDDNAGRLILSRLSTYYLTPVIDVGILLSSRSGGMLSGIDGRVTTMTPGAACLVCRDRIDQVRAAAELKTPEERRRLANEGYAPALGHTEPAVVAFTTAVAAAAVNELLDRLIGYGPLERPTETLLRIHERETSFNQAVPRERHYCHADQGQWGAGDVTPFLGQIWPS